MPLRAACHRRPAALPSADLAYARLPSRPRPVGGTPETRLPRKAGKSASGPRCSSHRQSRSLITDHSLPARLTERCRLTPVAAVRAMPARLLLLCLLFRGPWPTVEGDRHVGAAGVLHRRGGRAAVAVRVGVAAGVPERNRYSARSGLLLCRRQAGAVGGAVGPSLAVPRRPSHQCRTPPLACLLVRERRSRARARPSRTAPPDRLAKRASRQQRRAYSSDSSNYGTAPFRVE